MWAGRERVRKEYAQYIFDVFFVWWVFLEYWVINVCLSNETCVCGIMVMRVFAMWGIDHYD